MFLLSLFSAAVAYILWSLICLESNVRIASRMKVPCVRLPIDANNVPWMIIQPYVWAVLDLFPFEWSSYPDFIRFARRGWHFQDKSATHVRLGPVWALVSPMGINLHFSDATTINDIFSRRRDFIRPITEYKILEVYGPCISTAGFNDWPRHRKALAAPFNESIMNFVWEESLSQARAMLRAWVAAPETGIHSVSKDTRSISLNILAASGFRKSYEFKSSKDDSIDEGGSYRDALSTVLDNAIPLMLIPYRVLMLPLMPKRWAQIGNAGIQFKNHMVKMLDEEVNALKNGQKGAGGIMTSLVRALDVHEKEAGSKEVYSDSKAPAKGLSVDEIFGNIFVINFAGHDTTANTLAFSMLLLAGEPAIQNWVAEEIQELVGDTSPDSWEYKDLFVRLNRCRAILYETLRLYPPIMALPKLTNDEPQLLKIGNRDLHIPPQTRITPSVLAVHTHPQYWNDPLVWRPARWIDSTAPGPGEGVFFEHPKGTYFPWSDGVQNCPGKKFAEVEFVAILACLLHNHRMSIKRLSGETMEQAQARIAVTTNDVNMEMLLRMADADRVRLVCEQV